MGSTKDAMERLLDKQAIQEALYVYSRGVDRGDPTLIAAAYHPDSIDEHGAQHFTGETVGDGIIELCRSMRVTMHYITNVMIEFHDNDRAGCESYFSAWQTIEVEGAERIVAAQGRYLDRFERRDGEWKIAHRVVAVDLTILMPDSGFLPSSEPIGSRDRNDPSFALLAGQ